MTTFENYQSVVALIKNSPVFPKMMYIIENKQTAMFKKFGGNMSTLDNYCLTIANEKHHDVSFNNVLNTFYADYDDNHPNMAQYIISNKDLLKWVIEHVYWSDYKSQIDRLIGSQDITSLWQQITLYSHLDIDGIGEDIYSLRETCSKCTDLDINYDDMLECGCVGYNRLSNVWIVNEKRFYDCLTEQGAMVYETDSLFLFLQTSDCSPYYDSHLRRAWIDYGAMAWLGGLL